MKTLLKYDFLWMKRTSKLIIFPALAIFFAIVSPLTAKFMNDILTFALGAEGLGITLPPVTVLDSYVQYSGNLFELYLIVTIFVGVGIFMHEKNKGELPLILSKPIDRVQFILSKLFAFMAVIIISLSISGLVFAYYTYFLFDTVDLLIVLQMLGLYLVYILFILSIALVFSMVFNSYAAASVLTFVSYLVLAILGNMERGIMDYLPGRIAQRTSEVILGSVDGSVMVFFVFVTLLLSGVLLTLGIQRFRQYDI